MTRVLTMPLNNYTGGSYGPFVIPDDVSRFKLALARNTTATPLLWPDPATFVEASIEISLNGGVQWDKLFAWGVAGGLLLDGGTEVEECGASGGPLPAGVNRQIRGTVIVTGPALRSELRAEVD